MSIRLLIGDCRERLRELPDASVHCCVTSPPYFGLRDYGHEGQMGLEPTPDEFVAGMVEVFREVRRCLRDDGVLWLNIGDSYAGSWGARGRGEGTNAARPDLEAKHGTDAPNKRVEGCKPKDLIGIPWLLAFALRADGWYLRQDVIWSKPNPMPESVRDRCTKAHEYLFLLSKGPRYFYDAEAIAEQSSGVTGGGFSQKYADAQPQHGAMRLARPEDNGTRNKRSVWEVATQPFSEAHFATYPPALIEPCILAGCPERCCGKCGAPWMREVERTPMVLDRSERTHEKGRTRSSGTMLEPPTSKTLGFAPSCTCHDGVTRGTVLDPFGGAGTTGLVADRLQRDAILIELNPEYAEIARKRIAEEAGMFGSINVDRQAA